MVEKIIETKTDKVEGKVLGQRISAPKEYCPEILVRVPREENRTQYNIDEKNLPFEGFDVWNAYEISALTEKGFPLFLCAKIIYPANSKYIVESKSLKLYLNSFNMEQMGLRYDDAIENLENTIKEDLSNLLETKVNVHLYSDLEKEEKPVYKDFEDIRNVVDVDSIDFVDYNENKDIIEIDKSPNHTVGSIRLKFPMLRSNCKITHQPDWGTAFIEIEANKNIDIVSLCKYIVSFRNENHFHEECVEMIYKRLHDKLSDHNDTFKLQVSANYCRRGGIDICPIRVNDKSLFDRNMIHPSKICKKLLNQ